MASVQPAQPALFPQTPPGERLTGDSLSTQKKRPLRPGLSLCVLGSGSGGNCTIARLTDSAGNRGAVLLDAGFGIRRTTRKLNEAGIGWRHVRAVLLSHLDRDHFTPTLTKALVEHRVAVHLHHWHLDELAQAKGTQPLFDHGLVEPFGDGALIPMPGVTATTTRLQHDRQGTIGYRLSTRFGDVGFATDLGHAPRQLIDHFAGVDVLCIESNYDERMTVNSSRPVWVNRRNLSDSGHLSNEQAYEAVQQIRDRSPHGNPRHVVLLHRSQQCNHPTKVRRVFERDPELAKRVTLTDQRKRTRWINLKPLRRVQREQMCLAG
ncbi:MAG: MBL fold metallo-hydrolase [Phycisphaeraceae bacterium]|nr:MBL fold metallo-hydrolase [Phycisphaeraceae bacterium]